MPPVRTVKLAIVLGALTAITPLTIDTYLPALPTIAAEFRATDSAVQLTLTATLLGVAGGQLLMGPLADRFGRRRPLIAGLLLHLVASVLCAFAPNVELLMIARTLQGIGAAAGAVISLAIVRDLLTGLPAARLLARLMLVTGVAPILAPTIGSLVLRTTTWNGLFVLLALIAAALAVVAATVLPETLPPARRRTGGVLAAFRTYGTLLRERQFVGLTLVAGLAMTVILGYVSGASFVMQNQFGLSSAMFGIVFGANSIGLIVMSQLNPVLLRRFAAVVVLRTALVIATVGATALVTVSALDIGGLPAVMVAMFVTLASCGLAMPNLPGLALARHGEAAGTAAAVLGAVQFGAGALLAPLVAVGGEISALSMGLVILAGAAGALLVLLFVVRPRTLLIPDPADAPVVVGH
ncbi:Bcr/CflA family efflux MFS transporter [Nakamurella sp. YIM 132087]|uniref:Bcr/CflA family efflux MFS transporter n=1 Tax=Nakamurella alba TaxID=2665158 RepID=A0A7K1FIM5_9ACTN|nr:Bcr/CflA family efflux MFS transporter [Nakamurella alba]